MNSDDFASDNRPNEFLSEVRINGLLTRARPLVQRIIDSMKRRNLLHGDDPEDLLDRTFRYLRLFLRSATTHEFSRSTDEEFLVRLGLKALKVLSPEPISGYAAFERSPANDVMECRSGYVARVHTQPKYQVGGDLVCIHTASDGNVWILLADVTGKSVAAHLTAASLTALWEEALESLANDPLDVLYRLEHQLQGNLPDGIFAETALACANRHGEIKIAAAGYVQYLIGNLSMKTLDVVVLGGMFLGAGFPETFCIEERIIDRDDELVFASDGLFDQHTATGMLRPILVDLVKKATGETSVHDAVIKIMGDALKSNPQVDDISVVTLKRTLEDCEGKPR